MTSPAKILSFSPYAYWQLHALYEIAICHNLQWRGHSYRYVSCDGLFTDCDLFWESTVGRRPANACAVCQEQVKGLLEKNRVPHTWLGAYQAADVVPTVRAFVDGLADADLLRAEFLGYPLGSWVKSSVHTHLRINAIDPANAKHCAALRSYLYSGGVALLCIAQMLDAERPDVLLMFNGRMGVTRVALELAKERGIRVVCHERGLAKEQLLLWENEGCLSLRPYPKLWAEWGGVPLAAAEAGQVTRWLLDRARGANLNWKTFSVQSSLGPLAPFLERHAGRQIWSLFTSSTDEIVADDDRTSAFGTQNRWIDETIRFVRDQPGIALVVRVHPNSGGKKSTGRNLDELRHFEELKGRVPDNVAVVMPDDPVSSYALVDRTDVGFVYGSTIALEMACRGLPVFLAARSPWMPCDGIRFVTAADDYAALLAARAARPRTAAEAETIARAAYRFAYAYMFRWNIPFPLVRMPDVHHGELAAGTLEDFQPGKHACLDRCAEIVLGLRPSIPQATAPIAKGAAELELAAVRAGLDAVAGRSAEQAAHPVRISVVITCYNYGKYLRDCVRSVVGQTFKEWELIIVNDGSTDDSLAVAKACAEEFAGLPITIVDQPNSGQPALARNAGIRRAQGEFILPIDADDQIDPRYLEHAFRAIDADATVDLVYSDSLFDNGKTRVRKTPGRFEAKALAAANQLVYCCVYRRAVWAKVGGYRDNVRGYEDWDFWLAAALAGAKAVYIPRVGLLYNEKDSGVYSQTVSRHQVRTAQVMLNNSAAYSSAQLERARAVLADAAAATTVSAAGPKSPSFVSVVIPCYNQAQYLAEAVQSVFAQTYPHWEIVIVNDGSPDRTSEVAQGLILRHPDRKIRLIEKANGGLADARNAGIRFARGQYILPLDADDRIDPTFLAKTVALLDGQPGIAIAYTDWVYFGGHNTRRAALDYDFARLCKKENLFTCTSLFRREAWEAAGGYNPNMTRGVEDWDFWIGCGEKGFVGQRIPEPLFFYRAKEGSMIHTLQPHLPAMFARIILNHPKLYGPEAVKLAQRKFDAAQLPPPKPSSAGTEWLAPKATLADFQALVADAEAKVRAGQAAEALAVLEQALRQAPSEECAAKAREILELLRAELTPAAEPAAAADNPGGEEVFGAEEVAAIRQIIAAYAENPAEPSVRNQLAELQQGLMNFLVGAAPDALEKHFAGGLGQVFRALVKSGLTGEAPTPAAAEQMAILDEALAKTDGAPDVRPLLARMLVAPAHRGTVIVPLERLPEWLLDDGLGYVLHAPLVFVLPGEAEQYHDHLLRTARSIHRLTRTRAADPRTLRVAEHFALRVNCVPLYFSRSNTREFAELRAAIMEFVLLRKGAAIDAKLPKRPKGRSRIKVGFLSAHFGSQTETHVTLPALQLDRSRFEICLYPVARNPGPVEERCRSFADSFTPLPGNLHQQVKTIRDAELDVLIVGTNVTAVANSVSLIALHRLAPVQLTSYCSPVSTGMRHIDGFLTGTLNDAPGLQDHFSEQLRFCPGPPGCLDYTVETAGSGRTFDRAGLGLADDDVVFLNAAACFKILPEQQETWAKILAAVPKSKLVLLPFNPNWSSSFPVKQFERTLTEICARHGVARDRFVLAGSLPSRTDVKALERIADVYLDTAPFSGSISVIDPLELGLPPVVQDGPTHRARMAAALLRELEIPELVVPDEAAYIALAVRLANEPAYRAALRGRIAAGMARRPTFVNPGAYAAHLGRLLETLVRGAPAGVRPAARLLELVLQ